MQVKFDPKDIKGLEDAIARNPVTVKEQVSTLLARARSMYMGSIKREPWRLGGNSGGSPIDTGNLVRSHTEQMTPWTWEVRANGNNKAPYAVYVHEGTRNMSARPWLDYAIKTNDRRLQQMQISMLDYLVNDLAR